MELPRARCPHRPWGNARWRGKVSSKGGKGEYDYDPPLTIPPPSSAMWECQKWQWVSTFGCGSVGTKPIFGTEPVCKICMYVCVSFFISCCSRSVCMCFGLCCFCLFYLLLFCSAFWFLFFIVTFSFCLIFFLSFPFVQTLFSVQNFSCVRFFVVLLLCTILFRPGPGPACRSFSFRPPADQQPDSKGKAGIRRQDF